MHFIREVKSDFTVKKPLLLAAFIFIAVGAYAQMDVNKPTVKMPASGLDPSITGRGIMDVLTPGLKLDDNQNSKVTILVGQFLTSKSSFLDLMKSQPADYKSKFAQEQRSLFDGLKKELSPDQFKQLMDLKPPQASAENAIGHLFY